MDDQQMREAVAAVLRAERHRIDITQAELIKRSSLSRSALVRLEAGTRTADLAQIAAIASSLGMSMVSFIREVEKAIRRSAQSIPPGELAALDQLAAEVDNA